MTNVTEKDIMRLKNEAMAIRDQVISAKSTYDSIVKNIESYKEELKQLGVDPDNADEKIKEMAEKSNQIYEDALKTINQWKETMV
jgi:uncharacterized coiled-coil DUF342 family protein